MDSPLMLNNAAPTNVVTSGTDELSGNRTGIRKCPTRNSAVLMP